ISLQLRSILVPARNRCRVVWNRRSVKAGGGSDRQQEQRRDRRDRSCFSAARSLVGPRWGPSTERNQRVFRHRHTPFENHDSSRDNKLLLLFVGLTVLIDSFRICVKMAQALRRQQKPILESGSFW